MSYGMIATVMLAPTKAKIVEIFKQYNADMEKAGRPYRYS